MKFFWEGGLWQATASPLLEDVVRVSLSNVNLRDPQTDIVWKRQALVLLWVPLLTKLHVLQYTDKHLGDVPSQGWHLFIIHKSQLHFAFVLKVVVCAVLHYILSARNVQFMYMANGKH